MNSGNWSLEPMSQDMVLVTVALVLAGILAVLTIIGMVVGARNRAKRRAAEQEELARIEELRAEGKTAPGEEAAIEAAAPAPTPTPAQTPIRAAPPVAPSPPPASDEVAPGTLATLDEPIPAAAPLDAAPASVAADEPSGGGDADTPVTVLKGLGPKIAVRLGELGITTVGQLAWLDDQEAAELDGQLGAFQGRMERDRWREQARLLATGDRAGFEAAFGKLG